MNSKEIIHFLSFTLFLLGIIGFSVFLTSNSRFSRSNLNSLMLSFIYAYCGIIIIHHLFVLLGITDRIYFWNINYYSQYNILGATFGNIGTGKHLTAQLASIVIVSLIWFKNKLGKKFYIYILILTFLGIITFSRAFIFIFTFVCLLLIINKYKIKPIKIILGAAVVIYLFYYMYNNEVLHKLFFRQDLVNYQTIKRYLLFTALIDIFINNSLIGIGWENYKGTILNEYYLENFSEIGLLPLLCEQGIIRAGILVSIVIVVLSKSLKNIITSKNILEVTISIFSLNAIFWGMSWGSINTAHIFSFLFWLFIFISVNLKRSKIENFAY